MVETFFNKFFKVLKNIQAVLNYIQDLWKAQKDCIKQVLLQNHPQLSRKLLLFKSFM